MVVRVLYAIAIMGVVLFPVLALPDTPVTVGITDYAYIPQKITIKRGQSVTWTNNDESPHTVTANGNEFRSPPLDTKDTFVQVFDKPGSYPYYCVLHPHMTGVVEVE